MGVDANKIERFAQATWLSICVAFKGTVAQAAIYLGGVILGFGCGVGGVFIALYILHVISLPSSYLLENVLGVNIQSGEFAFIRQLPLLMLTNVFLWSSVAFIYDLIRGPRESND